MRLRFVLLLTVAALPANLAIAGEIPDESQAIKDIGRLGARLRMDDKLPGRPVVAIQLFASGSFREKDCRRLTAFKSLKVLNFGQIKIKDAGLKELRELPNLVELDLSHTEITDAGLRELRKLTTLAKLELAGNTVTDAGLKELSELRNLKTLGLSHTRITDSGLTELKDLRNLRELDLSDTKLTDVGLKELRTLANLAKLGLRGNTVTDFGLKELRQLHHLTEFDLGWTGITDAGLKELTDLKNLRELKLSDTKVTDVGLKQLQGLTNLATLHLDGTKVTGAGLAALKPLKNLAKIDIGFSEANLRGLAAVTSLREVNPYYREITDACLPALGAMKNLTVLDLSGATITDRGLKELRALQRLTKLDLSGTTISDAGLQELAELANLTELDLSSTHITGAGLKKMRGLRKLRKLDLRLTRVTDAGLKELGELANLTELDLSSTHITGAGLKQLGRLENLAELKLTQINITDADAKALRGLKRLTKLDLTANEITDAGLEEIGHVASLTALNLSVNLITDAGLKAIGKLENLTALDLGVTAITDAGLKELRRLKNLAELKLDYTDITGASLEDLGEVKKLRKLGLDGTTLTDAGLLQLRELEHLEELELPNRADAYKEGGYDVLIQGGWRPSPDFKRLIVPLWIKAPPIAPRVLTPSYSPLALLDLDRPGDFRILPLTGVNAQSSPAYGDSSTSWSANSAALAYFAEFDTGEREILGNRFDWHPVWLDLKTGKSVALTSIDFGQAPFSCRASIHLSPSGRYVLIAANLSLLNPLDPVPRAHFLLWEPAAGRVRELLHVEHASGFAASEVTPAWGADEKTIYLAVGSSDGNEVESWRLCECRLDGRLPYTPETAQVLFTLVNEKGYRETRPGVRFPFDCQRNLQILELRPKENSLIFYRGDTGSFWTMDLVTHRLRECFPSPFIKRDKGGVSFDKGLADTWTWRDADMLALIRRKEKVNTLLVGDPARPAAVREVTRGPIRLIGIEWAGLEWLTYKTSLGEAPQRRVPTEVRAVNIRSGETKVLVSENLQRRIRRQFLEEVARRKHVRKSVSSAERN